MGEIIVCLTSTRPVVREPQMTSSRRALNLNSKYSPIYSSDPPGLIGSKKSVDQSTAKHSKLSNERAQI